MDEDNTITWDRKGVLRLVQIYKNYELLWDPTHNDYKDKQLRRQAITNMADQMKIEKSEVERKIKNLSSHYMRELKKERESEMSSKPYKSKWFAYAALTFLNSRPPHFRMQSSIDQSNSTLASVIMSEADETNSNGSETTTLTPEQITAEATYEFMPKRIKIKNEDSWPDPFETIPQESNSSNRDESSTFGDYISSKIRSMDKKTKAIVEYEINSIIFKAEMGFYSDSDRKSNNEGQ